jgi:hypothetical protein
MQTSIQTLSGPGGFAEVATVTLDGKPFTAYGATVTLSDAFAGRIAVYVKGNPGTERTGKLGTFAGVDCGLWERTSRFSSGHTHYAALRCYVHIPGVCQGWYYGRIPYDNQELIKLRPYKQQ